MAMFNLLKKTLIVSACLLCASVTHAGSDVFIDFESSLSADDNVTRADENSDIENDVFFTVAGSGGYKLFQGRASSLVGKVLIQVNQASNHSGLSNAVIAGKLIYNFSFSRQFGAPWFAVDASYGVTEFDSFMRDSNIFRTTATMGMQIDDVTSMRLGLALKDRDAENSVFDTQNASLFLNLDWAMSKFNIVYFTYKYEVGDTFSSAASPGLTVIDASSSIVLEDDVFTNMNSYRLDAVTSFITLGYNRVNNLHSSFDFSARYLESEADDVDLAYEGLSLRFSYFRRFNL